MSSVAKKVAKEMEKAFDELYKSLGSSKGEKDLYRVVRKRDRVGLKCSKAKC